MCGGNTAQAHKQEKCCQILKIKQIDEDTSIINIQINILEIYTNLLVINKNEKK